MSKIIIANWKANPSTLDEAQELFGFSVNESAKYPNLQVVICPPDVYLEELNKQIQMSKPKTGNMFFGAQDMSWEKSGPYTGEVSTEMLKNLGVSYALIGHSDRRYKIGESEEVINKKIKAALAGGITPVLLVGERNKGDNRRQVLEQQLSADLAGLTADQVARVLIAYEPVWAISTNPSSEPDTPASTLEAVKIIKEFLGSQLQSSSHKILYGGSVNEKNAADFLKHPEISGAVIGGASLRKEEFGHILSQISLLT